MVSIFATSKILFIKSKKDDDLTFDAINTAFSAGVEHKMGKFNSNWPVGASPETQSKGGIFGRNDATGSEFRIYGAYFQNQIFYKDE